mgnify:CR=1 FL=1
MAANPNYGSLGEIPVAARGSGIQTIDGFMTRSPFESQVDLQASYVAADAGAAGASRSSRTSSTCSNQTPRHLATIQNTQLAYRTGQPGLRQAGQLAPERHAAAVQAPRNMRLGVRFEF